MYLLKMALKNLLLFSLCLFLPICRRVFDLYTNKRKKQPLKLLLFFVVNHLKNVDLFVSS